MIDKEQRSRSAPRSAQVASSEQPSLGTLLINMFDDATALLRQEIQLARVELGHKLQSAAGGATRLLSGALLAYLGLVTLIIVSLLALAHVLPLWTAGVVMGLLVIVIGGVLVQLGRNSLRILSVIPKQTLASTQADMAMVSNRISGTPVTTVPTQRTKAKADKSKVGQSKGEAERAVDAGKGSFWQVLKTTYTEWTEDEASLLAASLSYYTAISLAPLLVLIVVIVGLFLSQDAARDQVLGQLRGAIGTQGAQFLEIILENADQPQVASLAGVLSLLTLLWGSTNVFSQLQNSLNKIWNVEPKPGRSIWATLRERLLSFTMVLGVAFMLLVSFVLSAVLAALASLGQGWLPGIDWLWQVINFVISFGVITLLFAAIYKVLPDTKVEWRQVWVGAAATALLFTVGKTLLGWYLANAGSAYGAAGSLIVFLLWVYYSAQILFFGAEFTQVYARNQGQAIQPDEGAQPIGASA